MQQGKYSRFRSTGHDSSKRSGREKTFLTSGSVLCASDLGLLLAVVSVNY